MAALPARTRNQRAVRVAAISSEKDSRNERAARKCSAGVIVAAFVRGVTTSSTCGLCGAAVPRGGRRRLRAGDRTAMLVSFGGCRPGFGCIGGAAGFRRYRGGATAHPAFVGMADPASRSIAGRDRSCVSAGGAAQAEGGQGSGLSDPGTVDVVAA